MNEREGKGWRRRGVGDRNEKGYFWNYYFLFSYIYLCVGRCCITRSPERKKENSSKKINKNYPKGNVF
jgi:hypothetical protein